MNKTPAPRWFWTLAGIGSLATLLLSGPAQGAPLGTAFTYHGRLDDGGSPATGNYDLSFALYNASASGSPVGTPTTITLAPVGISNGLFIVTLDFGSAAFAGDARWLEVGVRTNGSLSPYFVLSPRQALTPAPYALFAPAAGTATSVAWSAITGIPAGFADGIDNDTTYSAGAGLTLGGTTFSVTPLGVTTAMLGDAAVSTAKLADGSVTAAKIGGGQVVKSLNLLKDDVSLVAGANVTITPSGNTLQISAATASGWGLVGNSGTTALNFLGTTDGQPLELRVNASRALRLEPDDLGPNVLGGADVNAVTPGVHGATIGGGGGVDPGPPPFGGIANPNRVTDHFGTVAGGRNNRAGSDDLIVDDAVFATVGGGNHNTASGNYATIPGGSDNIAAGDQSFAAGTKARANHPGSFVWGDATPAPFASSGANQFLIRASGGVGIGTSLPVRALDVRDGSGASGDGGGIHVGGTGANGDPKLVSFGDGDYVHIGEIGSDDTMELKAARFNFVGGEVSLSVLTITGGADLAEPFKMSARDIPTGALVVIDDEHPGSLKLSEEAYDKRVAGIVSGANGIRPGLTLHQEGAIEGGQNVALSGRVYALADASNGPIQPGDLLTTSSEPGHAMRVTDHTKAQGAIIGKAMGSLQKGRGMVLVLVSLQ